MEQFEGMVLKYHDFDLTSLKKLVNELIVDCDRYVGRVNVSYFIISDKLKVIVKYQNPIGELFKHSSWYRIANDYNNKGEYVEKYFEFDISELTKYKVLFFVKDILNTYNEKLTNIINNQWYLQYKLTHVNNDEWDYYYWNLTNMVGFTDDSMLDFLFKNNDIDNYRIEISLVNNSGDSKYPIYKTRGFPGDHENANDKIKSIIDFHRNLALKETVVPSVVEVL